MRSAGSSKGGEERLEGIEIIQDPVEIQKLAFSIIQIAIEEILVKYSTANAFQVAKASQARRRRTRSRVSGCDN